MSQQKQLNIAIRQGTKFDPNESKSPWFSWDFSANALTPVRPDYSSGASAMERALRHWLDKDWLCWGLGPYVAATCWQIQFQFGCHRLVKVSLQLEQQSLSLLTNHVYKNGKMQEFHSVSTYGLPFWPKTGWFTIRGGILRFRGLFVLHQSNLPKFLTLTEGEKKSTWQVEQLDARFSTEINGCDGNWSRFRASTPRNITGISLEWQGTSALNQHLSFMRQHVEPTPQLQQVNLGYFGTTAFLESLIRGGALTHGFIEYHGGIRNQQLSVSRHSFHRSKSPLLNRYGDDSRTEALSKQTLSFWKQFRVAAWNMLGPMVPEMKIWNVKRRTMVCFKQVGSIDWLIDMIDRKLIMRKNQTANLVATRHCGTASAFGWALFEPIGSHFGKFPPTPCSSTSGTNTCLLLFDRICTFRLFHTEREEETASKREKEWKNERKKDRMKERKNEKKRKNRDCR